MSQVKAATRHPAPAKAVVTTPTDREIHVTRIFNAPRERVWKAYTDAKLIAQWWGRGNKVDVEKFEPVRGGHWRIVEHAKGETHGFEGRFAEITPMDRITWTFEWDGLPGHPSIETVNFEDLGDGRTRINATSMFFTNAERDGMIEAGMESGMHESYEALDRLLLKTE
jgi:uncharacterized protein YndB with AHSA1/START domain